VKAITFAREKRRTVEKMERDPEPREEGRRPYIGIYFRCCQVYQRIYRKPDKDRYASFCPKCLRPVTVRVSPDGCANRLFEAE
jgi:hypothetical protein